MTGEKAPVRIAIRGFADGELKFEDRIDLAEEAIETLLPALAETHGQALAQYDLSMIEVQFLDEPDPEQAFFRFGNDPRGMVRPVAVDLDALTGDKRDVD